VRKASVLADSEETVTGQLVLTKTTLDAAHTTFSSTATGNHYVAGTGLADTIALAGTLGTLTWVEAGAGNDRVTGKSGADLFSGGAGDDILGGGAGNDQLLGAAGLDRLDGGDGADILDGGLDNDRLSGGAGNDTLTGGAGRDVFTGGLGNDRFVFRPGDFGGATRATGDLLAGWNAGDRIDLGKVDADTTTAGNQTFAFLGTAAFNTADSRIGEVRFDRSASGVFVYGDQNGDGIADFVIRVDGISSLSAGDFIL